MHQVKRLDFLRLDTDGYAQIAELGAGDVFVSLAFIYLLGK